MRVPHQVWLPLTVRMGQFLDDWADLNKDVDGGTGCIDAVAKLKRQNPHIEILVSLGGGTGSAEFPELAASESARQALAREAREFCDRHGFDGVDRELSNHHVIT